MINTGEATAADFECLGNEIVSKVKKYSGVELQWEIQKIGNF
jgi:UDP-N-acetylmuramate dehydrogenase